MGWVTVPADLRGEEALSVLPRRGEPPSAVMLLADGVTAIDAWGAIALRQHLELSARAQSQSVCLSPPKDPDTWHLAFSLLEPDWPMHFELAKGASRPAETEAPTTVVLPAIRVPTIERAEAFADVVLERAEGRLRKPLRFAAEQLPEFVANSLRHARAGVTDPVACIFFDREYDEVQLVVSDLGLGFQHDPDPTQALHATVMACPDGGLTLAAEVAQARGLDATLTLAAGAGRLYWRAGTWVLAPGQLISGFTAALTIPVP